MTVEGDQEGGELAVGGAVLVDVVQGQGRGQRESWSGNACPCGDICS